jgi:tetratricopeptide (TPR) repeat protein
MVAHQRFKDARAANLSEEELLRYLNEAVGFSLEALDLLPPDAVDALADTHNQLGEFYRSAGNLDRVLSHFRQALQLFEKADDPYWAAATRFNVALAFSDAGRRSDALEYAEAALRGFESYGERAGEMIEKTRGLIAEIRGR